MLVLVISVCLFVCLSVCLSVCMYKDKIGISAGSTLVKTTYKKKIGEQQGIFYGSFHKVTH